MVTSVYSQLADVQTTVNPPPLWAHTYFLPMNIEYFSFLTISFFIAVTPGPSVIYVVSYSLRYGAKAGIASTLGINVGSIVAILIAAFGLSTLLETYPMAIVFIQILGGLFVIYLAFLMWPRHSAISIDEQLIEQDSYKNLFKNGFITSVLNPKDILFYTAFIPTFIPQETSGNAYLSTFLFLAFSYMAIGFVTKSSFALFSGYAKHALHSKNANVVNILSSMILFTLGIFLLGNI